MRPCHSFLRREGVLGVGHQVVFPFHQCITFCKVQVMQYMVLAEGQVISPAILMDFLRMKRKVLHCERAYLKVPGWLLV